MRKHVAVPVLLAVVAAFAWTAHASTQEATSGSASPQMVVVPDNRAALEAVTAEAQAKVADLRERTIESQEEYQARVGAALGDRAPEATFAPVATIAPTATVAPPVG